MTAQPDQPAQERADRTAAQLIGAIDTIRQHWTTLLEPASGRPNGGSPSTDTLTATERRISLRQDVAAGLTRWCRVIVTDRHLTTGALPHGGDEHIHALLDFIDRHAAWFATEHDDAARAARHLSRLADDVRDTAEPPVRDHVYLGPCPFVLPDPDDDTFLWACRGRVLTQIGGDGSARCTGCEQEAVREWWEEVLDLVLPLVTLPRLMEILHRRLGIRISERTLRNWRRDGIIRAELTAANHEPPHGVGPALQWDLFDPRRVVAAVADIGRVCALCGHPWDGGGDVCRACWAATVQATPTTVDEPLGPRIAGIPVTIRARPWQPPTLVVPNPHDTDRTHRCHYSDLPIGQCACGRHREDATPNVR